MRSLNPLSIVALLLLAGLSGCFGDDAPTKAGFLATPMGADKNAYKFDASPSTGEGLAYSWNFGDRTTPGTGKVVEHTYEYPNGKYSVTLTVTDGTGKKSTMTQQVQVGSGSNNAPLLYLKADKRLVTPDESVVFDGTQSYDADGDPLFFEWDFNTMMADDELNKIENLGTQQYGRYAKGPPPSSSGNSSNGGEGQATNSGHDWTQEYEKAVKRFLAEHGVTTLDGDHSAPPPEPRNENFTGKINDTSPIQLFSFPSPATYFVHVRVYDVKGEFAEGFLRIRVSDTVPNATDTYALSTDLIYSPAPIGGGANGAGDTVSFRRTDFTMAYPGNVSIMLTYAEDPTDGPLTSLMGAWLCVRTNPAKDNADCKDDNNGKSGTSPLLYQFDVRADKSGPAGGWTFLVSNEDNSRTKASAKVVVINDLNPWAKQEAGLEVGHH
ncbi:MAG: PKD domain-containing protein [Euryarchaeota archaeon]|nr:PKD domain-containing protein [Euryarchaeota archaeon]